jgi:hypothetical protein
MSFHSNPTFASAARYFAFNGVVAVFATFLLHDFAQRATALTPAFADPVEAEPSRVEKFKDAEAAAAQAPQVPVPRPIVARSMPDVPVQVLAVRLDQAESLKIKPLQLKRKLRMSFAKPTARNKRAAVQTAGTLPPAVVESASREAGMIPAKKARKRPVLAESSRDITNRSLGVLVAMKN